jgi:alpha-ketoglutarate-dependent taurine dioxygenase
MQRLGQLSGKPSTSGLHVHPIYPVSAEARAYKGDDDEISVISSKFKEKSGKVYGEMKAGGDKRANKVYTDKESSKAAFSQKKQSMKTEWHSDIAFENVPSDYTMLRLTEVPTSGGGREHS